MQMCACGGEETWAEPFLQSCQRGAAGCHVCQECLSSKLR